MIKNFEDTKKQLKDLAEVVNAFKSEAVQLRVVELVFGLEEDTEEEPQVSPKKRKAAKKKTAPKSSSTSQAKKTNPGKKAGGQGAVSTLSKLVEGNFFEKSKSIADIVQHCEHNLARKFKQNEFSGKLARLVRDGTLKRTKNAENQYEYQNG